jgi:hypothetical protein
MTSLGDSLIPHKVTSELLSTWELKKAEILSGRRCKGRCQVNPPKVVFLSSYIYPKNRATTETKFPDSKEMLFSMVHVDKTFPQKDV